MRLVNGGGYCYVQVYQHQSELRLSITQKEKKIAIIMSQEEALRLIAQFHTSLYLVALYESEKVKIDTQNTP